MALIAPIIYLVGGIVMFKPYVILVCLVLIFLVIVFFYRVTVLFNDHLIFTRPYLKMKRKIKYSNISKVIIGHTASVATPGIVIKFLENGKNKSFTIPRPPDPNILNEVIEKFNSKGIKVLK